MRISSTMLAILFFLSALTGCEHTSAPPPVARTGPPASAASLPPAPGLEFRILATQSQLSPERVESVDGKPRGSIRMYEAALDAEGPPAVRDDLGWFEIGMQEEDISPSLVAREHDGKTYVLAYTSPGNTMLHGGWRVLSASESRDQMGRPTIIFRLDAKGAKRLGPLSKSHIGHFLGIFVADRLVAAATIQSELRDGAQITGQFTQQEIEEMLQRIGGQTPSAKPKTREPNPQRREVRRAREMPATLQRGHRLPL